MSKLSNNGISLPKMSNFNIQKYKYMPFIKFKLVCNYATIVISIPYLIKIIFSEKMEKFYYKSLKKKSIFLKTFLGLYTKLISNFIIDFNFLNKTTLKMTGVGYKFSKEKEKIIISIGYSHKIEINIPKKLSIQVDNKRGLILSIVSPNRCNNKNFAMLMISVKKPDAYKGKGVEFINKIRKLKKVKKDK